MACKECRFRLCHEAGMRYRARKEMLDEQAPPIADGTRLAAVMRAHNLSLCEMRKVFLKNCRCHDGNAEKEVPEVFKRTLIIFLILIKNNKGTKLSNLL
jgi:hypothetical protein